MDRTSLRKTLEDAVQVYPPETAPPYSLSLMMHDAANRSEKADPRLVRLLEELARQQDLEIFNGKMQVFPGNATRIEYAGLACWLLKRTSSEGSNVALTDLDRYVAAEELSCTLTLALTGITTDVARDLGRGIHLVPWDSLPYSSQKESVHERAFSGNAFHIPTCAMTRAVTIPKRHIDATELNDMRINSPDDTELHDAVRCLGLVGPSAVHLIAQWIAVPEWVPHLGGSMSLLLTEGFGSNRTLSDAEHQQGRHLFHRFLSHPAAFQVHLRVPMDRLNRAIRRTAAVDSFIDLGIALESLYLSDMDDDRGELTFRLRVRASRFLRTTTEERAAVFDVVRDIYGARSTAVHTGKVDATVRGRPVQELLQEGYSLTADTVRRFIVSGEPEWKGIILQ